MQPDDPNRPAPMPPAPETQPPASPAAEPVAAPVAPEAVPPAPEYAEEPAIDDTAVEPELSDEAAEAADEVADSPSTLPPVEPVQWHAIEYIQRDKTPLWYVGFVAVVVALMALAVLLIRSWTFAILIPVMAAALMVYSHRPPRELNYVLSEKGLYINDQLHALGEFKGFGVIQDVQLHSLMLIPVRRFRPGLTVYFPTEVGERIVDLLGAYLPMQELHLDAFDKIVRKLRL